MVAKKKHRSGTILTDAQRAEYGMGKLTLRLEQKTIDELTRLAKAAGISRGELIDSWVWKKK
jgi:predicted HicB family RNase H-like nuclease